jgi:hypothetical protein
MKWAVTYGLKAVSNDIVALYLKFDSTLARLILICVCVLLVIFIGQTSDFFAVASKEFRFLQHLATTVSLLCICFMTFLCGAI